MASSKNIISNNGIFKGLDTSTSELSKSMPYASDMKNAVIRRTGDISKRKGFNTTNGVVDKPFLGATTFNKVDPETGNTIEENIVVRNGELCRLSELNSIEIYNNTYNEDITVDLVVNEGEYLFTVKQAGENIYQKVVGKDGDPIEGDDVGTEVQSIYPQTAIVNTNNFNYSDVIVEKYFTEVGPQEFTYNFTRFLVPETMSRLDECNNANLLGVFNAFAISPTNPDQSNITFDTILTDITPTGTVAGQFSDYHEYRIEDENQSILLSDISANQSPAEGDYRQFEGAYYWVQEGTAGQDIKVDVTDGSFPGLKVQNATNAASNIFSDCKIEVNKPVASAGVTYLTQPYASPIPTYNNYIPFESYKEETLDLIGQPEINPNNELANPDMQNVSFATVNNVLYASNGFDNVVKYDGNKVYRAGLPVPADLSVSTSSRPANTTYEIDSINYVTRTEYDWDGRDYDTYSWSGGSYKEIRILFKDSNGDPVNDIDFEDYEPIRFENIQGPTNLNGPLNNGNNTNEAYWIIQRTDPNYQNGRTYAVLYEDDTNENTYKKIPVDATNFSLYVQPSGADPDPEMLSYYPSNAPIGVVGGKYYEYFFRYRYTDYQGNTISSERSNLPVTVGDGLYVNNDGLLNLTAFTVNDTFRPIITIPAPPEPGFDWANVDVEVYRSKGYTSSVGQFYLLETISGGSGARTIEDTTSDEDLELLALTGVFEDYIKRHDPPPKGRFLTVHNNCLVISGQLQNVNNVQFSMTSNDRTGEIGSEYFPEDNNGFIVEPIQGGSITGIASLKDFMYIFHKDSIHVLTGDITDPVGISFRLDAVSKEGGIGCESHGSIIEFKDSLMFLSSRGYYVISRGAPPQEFSAPIRTLFDIDKYSFSRALSFNLIKEDMLLLIIPAEDVGTGDTPFIYTTSESLVLAFDYKAGAWLKWTNMDFSGGVCGNRGDIFYLSKGYRTGDLATRRNTGTTYDYCDGFSPIDFNYTTNHESLGQPTTFKKFLRLKVHSLNTDDSFESGAFRLDLSVRQDFTKESIGNINIDFGDEEQYGWANDMWGESSWGADIPNFRKMKLPSPKAKSLQLSFSNNQENKNVLLSSYELEVTVPYRPEMKE